MSFLKNKIAPVIALASLFICTQVAFPHGNKRSGNYRGGSQKGDNDRDNDSKKKKKRDNDNDSKKSKSSKYQKPNYGQWSSGQSAWGGWNNWNQESGSSEEQAYGGESEGSESGNRSGSIVEAHIGGYSRSEKSRLKGTSFENREPGSTGANIGNSEGKKAGKEESKLSYSEEEILAATRNNDVKIIKVEEDGNAIIDQKALANASPSGSIPSESGTGGIPLALLNDSGTPKSGASSSEEIDRAVAEKKIPSDPWIYHIAKNSKESVVNQLKADPKLRESLRKRLQDIKSSNVPLSTREKEYYEFMAASLMEAEAKIGQKEERIEAASQKEFFASINSQEGLTPSRFIAEWEESNKTLVYEPWMDKVEPLFQRVRMVHVKVVREGRL